MVVNNAVSGDSRVQRCAAAAAGAGWDVTVLGRSSDSERHEQPGPAGSRVVLLPVTPLASAGGLRGRIAGHRRTHPRLRGRDAVAGHRSWPWRHGAWRILDPWLADYELAIHAEIETLRPDVIHVHDRHPVPAVARSVAALRAAGHPVSWLIDAHEDVVATADRGIGGIRGWARRRMVGGALGEWIGEADAVVTVSAELAETLRSRHGLAAAPTVVQNAPLPPDTAGPVGTGCDETGPAAAEVEAPIGLRERLALEADTPLLTYVGVCAPARGVQTAIDALPVLDSFRGRSDTHLAVVASPGDPHVAALLDHARSLGLGARVHRVDYVPADQVIDLIRSADLGLVPLLHRPNHEIALVTKYLEYLHAGLPVVCSDVRTMARFTQEHGVGEVFPAGDANALAATVHRMLPRLVEYRNGIAASSAVAETAWPAQAQRLLRVYEQIAPAAEQEPA